MTSRNFSFKGLLGDSLRRCLWGFVLGGIGFFMTLLLPLLMTMQRELQERALYMVESPEYADIYWQNALDSVQTLLGGGNPFVKAMLTLLAIVCGVALFAYLHSRQKVDFYHSLPISRTRLFCNNFLTGLIVSWSTYLVALAISVACAYGMGFGAAVQWGDLGGAVISHLIVFLVLYALSVLTTVLCGNTVITLLLLLWTHLSFLLVWTLRVGLFTKFFESYAMDGIHMIRALRWSPVVMQFTLDGLHYSGGSDFIRMVAQNGSDSAAGLLVVYLLVAIAAAALACWLFRIRRSERAGVALAFTPVKLPLKIYICLVMGISFGLVLDMIGGNLWFWVGLFIGTVLFHWVVEIIYAFDFHALFGKPVHLLAILAVLVAGMLCLHWDVTGYDRWLPDRASVQAAAMSSSEQEALKQPENIDAICRLAEIGRDVNREATYEQDSYHSMRLLFQLDGRTEVRHYVLPDDDEVRALLTQVYDSEEYKRTVWPLFQVDLETPDQLQLDIYTNNAWYGNTTSVDQQAVRQILTTLREEALQRPQNSLPVLRMELMSVGEGRSRYWGDIFVAAEDKKTLALLEELDGVTPLSLTSDDVKAINLQYSLPGVDGLYAKTVEVTDPVEVQTLLQGAVNRNALNMDPSTALSNGFRMKDGDDDVSIIAVLTRDGSEEWITLAYAEADWPEALVEKYRPQGVDAADSAAVGVPTEAVG